jgi:hypothetical protein
VQRHTTQWRCESPRVIADRLTDVDTAVEVATDKRLAADA